MRSRSHLGDCTTSGNDVQGCLVCVAGRVRGTGVSAQACCALLVGGARRSMPPSRCLPRLLAHMHTLAWEYLAHLH